MAKCLRCGAGNEWIEGKASPSALRETRQFAAALIELRAWPHGVHVPKRLTVIVERAKKFLSEDPG